MNDMREKIANVMYYDRSLKTGKENWKAEVDIVKDVYLRRADQVLSLETKTHRIAVIKKGKSPLLGDEEIKRAIDKGVSEDMNIDPEPEQLYKYAVQAQKKLSDEYYKGD
ncbi:hypothetical protein LCGC14_0988720 [marine sediment metagenome]|uniref:Uncharacterized protein n=1 Tax=marine sediment metagenome TaxID=412755 RepID=A0A0F9RD24_9ZZZZ